MANPDPRLVAAVERAAAAGVRPLVREGPAGPRIVGYSGRDLDVMEYLEAVRRFSPKPPAPPDPARLAAKAHRRDVERWRRGKRAGKILVFDRAGPGLHWERWPAEPKRGRH